MVRNQVFCKLSEKTVNNHKMLLTIQSKYVKLSVQPKNAAIQRYTVGK